ncbi:MAG: FkbM family methyltransferase [Chitinophagaceae bacterium]|nr:FkbM family methyltransferase [Chitinophagaceae bacterium]
MSTFSDALAIKVRESFSNYYGKDNYDEFRFGAYRERDNSRLEYFKTKLRALSSSKADRFVRQHIDTIASFMPALEQIWKNVDDSSRRVLVEVVAFRLLGHEKVKLSTNSPVYRKGISDVEKLVASDEVIDPGFMHFVLRKYNLHQLGFDLTIFFTHAGVVIDYILEQYAYKQGASRIVAAEEGDVVLDIGACWGDTALYFASRVGKSGKVFSFEFLPGNIEIFNKNLLLNPQLAAVIEIIPRPVSDESNKKVYFSNAGPGSRVSEQAFDGYFDETSTIAVDDFVLQKGIDRVDFLKMDIEGAEPLALKGALATIKKFRPKLAIAIYHGMNDFTSIPLWLMEQKLGYQFFIGHYTIHSEETVLFGLPLHHD